MKNIFESDKFDIQVIAQGTCLDHLNDKTYTIETVTFRLNHVALNAWSDSEMMNSRDCYETDKEWKHQEKYKVKRYNVKRMILESLGMDAEPERISICQVVSEVFTAVHISEITGMEKEIEPTGGNRTGSGT
ncbi:hypothetical protein [[Clostridium] symbiosum]|uniref:hypothetical protein n=1 Tax=Clostridium symbiosum TaxID=1512 RepID=UPI001232D21B|nr:hypothetical protein [[Clostridium] symbiosum]KAA6136513.1 hypothetical protein F2P57_15555 [[Clostridium] symbiosum]